MLPVRSVHIRQSPLMSSDQDDSIYFYVPAGSGSPVLQATFEPDTLPSPTDFKLLKRPRALRRWSWSSRAFREPAFHAELRRIDPTDVRRGIPDPSPAVYPRRVVIPVHVALLCRLALAAVSRRHSASHAVRPLPSSSPARPEPAKCISRRGAARPAASRLHRGRRQVHAGHDSPPRAGARHDRAARDAHEQRRHAEARRCASRCRRPTRSR